MMTHSTDAKVAGAIPAGMKAWAGGDSAPADWDGGRVMCRDGLWLDAHNIDQDNEGWAHVSSDSAGDIIAYTPKLPKPSNPPVADAMGVEAMREACAKRAEHYGRCFGEKPPSGERGTNIVWSTAHAIAALIRKEGV